MNDSQAMKCLDMLMVLYSKKQLKPAEIDSWMMYLEELEFDAAMAAVNHLKRNGYNDSNGNKVTEWMPNIPTFATLYKMFRKEDEKIENRYFCWVCLDKGVMFYCHEEAGNKYFYPLYCDSCEKGNSQKTGKEDAISKFFNPSDLVMQNKKSKREIDQRGIDLVKKMIGNIANEKKARYVNRF